jgi:hypothetical protein
LQLIFKDELTFQTIIQLAKLIFDFLLNPLHNVPILLVFNFDFEVVMELAMILERVVLKLSAY